MSLARYTSVVRNVDLVARTGRVIACQGNTIESVGPSAFLGELCEIYAAPGFQPIQAEVIGFRQSSVLLMPYGDTRGIRPGCEVLASGRSPSMPVGEQMLGRVIDGFGMPIDDKGPIDRNEAVSLLAKAPNPVQRSRIREVFETGVKMIDGCLTVGRGQRIGVFSGSGVGKSTLMGMIARHSNADVNVIALIGERGREVRDFIEEHLGAALRRSVVIVATSDQPALARTRAAFGAVVLAEYFRDRGRSVALMMDSLTRLSMAQREIGLAAGEPPTVRGYTPSAFSVLPALLERIGCGTEGKGAITGFLTVLVEGDDLSEPVADHARAILDGHIVLSRALAHQGRYPAIDLAQSISRVSRQVSRPEEVCLAEASMQIWDAFENSKDMVDYGAYKPGINPSLDRAIRLMPELKRFFAQRIDESIARADTLRQLSAIVGETRS